MAETLLATDLDGTLVGDVKSLRTLQAAIQHARQEDTLKFVYITGRSLELHKALQAEQQLPDPDALVTAVGTEIYIDGVVHDTNWPRVSDWNRAEVERVVAGIAVLQPQPESEQRPFKISYFLEDDQATADFLKSKLETMPVDVVYSHGRYIDILPKGINKGGSLAYLAKLWHIQDEHIIACGDSGNDIDMLEHNKAIVVANAYPELLDWARQVTTANNVYLAQQPYAAGILEGLQYYGVVR